MFRNLLKLFGGKSNPIPDDTEYIYLSEDGDFNFPLTYEDNAVYAAGLNDIRTIFIKWIAEDQRLAAETGQRIEGTVSYLLGTLDLKFLANPSSIQRLLDILQCDGITQSGSRFLDAIMLIYATVPTPVLECYKGKFLYGVIYGLPNTIDENKLPTKEMWVELLRTAPYAPFILLLQEVLSDSLNINVQPSPVVQQTEAKPAP